MVARLIAAILSWVFLSWGERPPRSDHEGPALVVPFFSSGSGLL